MALEVIDNLLAAAIETAEHPDIAGIDRLAEDDSKTTRLRVRCADSSWFFISIAGIEAR